MRTLFLSVLVVLLSPVQGFAGPGGNDCDKARSSADVMKCLSAQYEAAQEELNKAFDVLSLQNTDEALAEIKDIQTHWLEYRTLECAQETSALETESLKRLESLRCMNRLTQERVVALQSALQNVESETVVGEAAASPRWMNALANDNPHAFWRYGERIEGDLDCDGESEHIMSGLKVVAETGAMKPIVSISENPATGRPESIVVPVESSGEEEDVTCGLLMETQYVQQAEEEAAEGEELESKACQNHLIVTLANCVATNLSWDGEMYVFGE